MKLIALILFLVLSNIRPASAFDARTLEQILPIAIQGNAEAQYHVGMLYNNGIGGAKKDPKQAFEWFQKSAAGNDPLGAYKVGCYFAGQFPGAVAVDMEKALEYKLIAANAGYALAQSDVGNIYGQRGNYAEAGTWWKLAAAQGFAQAAYNLSTWFYVAEDKVPGGHQDKTMAYAYFKISRQLALRGGSPRTQSGVDKIAQTMTPDEIRNAEKFVAAWVASPSEVTSIARNSQARMEALLKLRPAGVN